LAVAVSVVLRVQVIEAVLSLLSQQREQMFPLLVVVVQVQTLLT
jgi:hypothetical protein